MIIIVKQRFFCYILTMTVCLGFVMGCAFQSKSQMKKNEYSGKVHEYYNLNLEFKKPIKMNVKRMEKLTGKHVYYSDSNDYYYIIVTQSELKSLLGLAIITTRVPGIGNKKDNDSIFMEIEDIFALKPEFQLLLKFISVIDDPKFEVYDDAE